MPVPEDQYLFVYGTLLKSVGHVRHRILAEGAAFVGRASFCGNLFMADDYPAVTHSTEPGDSVVGELYRLNDPKVALRQLDRYEGYDPGNARQSLYVREMREVVLLEPGTRIGSWIYIYNRPTRNLTPIPSGDYLEFTKNGGARP